MNLISKLLRLVGFLAFYLKELLLANLRVAHDAVTPTHHMRPAFLAIPLDATTDAEILLFANLMTMTPGSVSVDVSSDRRVLYVHVMYVEDAAAERREIKEHFERRVLQLLR